MAPLLPDLQATVERRGSMLSCLRAAVSCLHPEMIAWLSDWSNLGAAPQQVLLNCGDPHLLAMRGLKSGRSG